MKTRFLLLFFITNFVARADVYIVNNQMEADKEKKIFTTLQAAHDAASSGDTIYVEGSSVRYDDATITISKKLYVVGPGYFPGENPSVQVNKNQAEIYGIKISQGGAGSKLEGISTGSISLYADDIIITHCNAGVYIYEDINNLSVTKSHIEYLGNSNSKIQNLMFANNIVNWYFELKNGSSGIAINNTFDLYSYGDFEVPNGITIKNTILIAENDSDINIPTLPNSDIAYNISTSDVFGTANGNLANVDVNNLFIGHENGSTDGQYQLKENSPAKGAGENGVDIGAFGGPDPYVLSGVPSIPVIYELNVSGFSNDEDKLPVTIKAKSR